LTAPNAPAQAAACTAGNHWLLLWGLVVSGICTWLIVRWRILDRLVARDALRPHQPATGR